MEEKKPIKEEKKLQDLSIEEIDKMIGVIEDLIKEREEALRLNVEYPTNKQKDKLFLAEIEMEEKKTGKKMEKLQKYGWFWNLFLGRYKKQNIENRLKSNTYKLPKKMGKIQREVLEKMVKDYKSKIGFLTRLKEEKKGKNP